MLRCVSAILTGCLLLAPAAFAQEFPPIAVTTAVDSEGTRACSVTHRSVRAAVESELRQNRADVVPVTSPKGLEMSAELIAVAHDNACSVGFDLMLAARQPVLISATYEYVEATVVFCSRGGVTVGLPNGMQQEVNSRMRDLTNECLSEYSQRSMPFQKPAN